MALYARSSDTSLYTTSPDTPTYVGSLYIEPLSLNGNLTFVLLSLYDTRVSLSLRPSILNAEKKALAGRRNRSQGVPSLVPVVTKCEGSRKGAGLEVGFRPNGFSEKKKILGNTRLLTCPGIVGASDRLYYRP